MTREESSQERSRCAVNDRRQTDRQIPLKEEISSSDDMQGGQRRAPEATREMKKETTRPFIGIADYLIGSIWHWYALCRILPAGNRAVRPRSTHLDIDGESVMNEHARDRIAHHPNCQLAQASDLAQSHENSAHSNCAHLKNDIHSIGSYWNVRVDEWVQLFSCAHEELKWSQE